MKDKFCNPYIMYIYNKLINLEQEETESNQRIIQDVITKEIFNKTFKSLVYCMNAERIEGNLIGSTSAERYIFFSATDFCIIAMNKHFPNIYEQLHKELDGKIKYLFEIFRDFKINQNRIYNYFKLDLGANLKHINCSGDWHNDKCVIILTLDDNSNIVYKPTNANNIKFIKELLMFFFDENYVSLYNYLSLNNNGTWFEYIQSNKIDKSLVSEFYYNYGKLIFVTYILGMTDLHYENVIANNVYPVITDIETMFSSYLFFETKQYKYDAQKEAVKQLLFSTVSTGLLPIVSMSDYFGGDISCLSNKGLRVPFEKLVNEYQDNLSICSAFKHIFPENHLPNLDINPLDYNDSILEGFFEAERIFLASKKEILSFLKNIHQVESRIILTMTKIYSKFVRLKSDPKYRFDNNLFEEILLKKVRMKRSNTVISKYKEIELRKTNIPSFYWQECLGGAYAKEDENILIVQKINLTKFEILKFIEWQTEKKRIDKEQTLIINSIKTVSKLEKEQMNKSMDMVLGNSEFVFNPIADVNNNKVIGKDGTVNWIGLRVNAIEQLEYSILDWSIYSGITGIGYMYLVEYLNNKTSECLNTLHEIVNTFIEYFVNNEFQSIDVSYYSGLTGFYAFFSNVLSAGICTEDIESILPELENLIIKNIGLTNVYDTLNGIHSAVIYFYGRYIINNDKFAKYVLIKIKEHWKINFKYENVIKKHNYASFAHGYSGIITSLCCINDVDVDMHIETIIKNLIQSENELKTSELEWLDKRSSDKLVSPYWCHGTCGIMISRLILIKYNLVNKTGLDLNETKNILSRYRTNVLDLKQIVNNYSLCHGNFALIDFLHLYDQVFDIDNLVEVGEFTKEIVKRAKKQGYSCIGTPGAINAIGLMVGEAGIHYVLNRESSNNKSILTMEVLLRRR